MRTEKQKRALLAGGKMQSSQAEAFSFPVWVACKPVRGCCCLQANKTRHLLTKSPKTSHWIVRSNAVSPDTAGPRHAAQGRAPAHHCQPGPGCWVIQGTAAAEDIPSPPPCSLREAHSSSPQRIMEKEKAKGQSLHSMFS